MVPSLIYTGYEWYCAEEYTGAVGQITNDVRLFMRTDGISALTTPMMTSHEHFKMVPFQSMQYDRCHI